MSEVPDLQSYTPDPNGSRVWVLYERTSEASVAGRAYPERGSPSRPWLSTVALAKVDVRQGSLIIDIYCSGEEADRGAMRGEGRVGESTRGRARVGGRGGEKGRYSSSPGTAGKGPRETLVGRGKGIRYPLPCSRPRPVRPRPLHLCRARARDLVRETGRAPARGAVHETEPGPSGRQGVTGPSCQARKVLKRGGRTDVAAPGPCAPVSGPRSSRPPGRTDTGRFPREGSARGKGRRGHSRPRSPGVWAAPGGVRG